MEERYGNHWKNHDHVDEARERQQVVATVIRQVQPTEEKVNRKHRCAQDLDKPEPEW
jgi:hypothetical protein